MPVFFGPASMRELGHFWDTTQRRVLQLIDLLGAP
jgi:hypothetical protein